MGPEQHTKFRKKLMSQSQENLRTDGRRARRTDGRTDKPYFIDPIFLDPILAEGPKKKILLSIIIQKGNFYDYRISSNSVPGAY